VRCSPLTGRHFPVIVFRLPVVAFSVAADLRGCPGLFALPVRFRSAGFRAAEPVSGFDAIAATGPNENAPQSGLDRTGGA
jgi:hypothetical protein